MEKPTLEKFSAGLGIISAVQSTMASADEMSLGSLQDLILIVAKIQKDIAIRFNELTRLWKSERQATSLSMKISMHPAYQQIIGLGKPAIPLILRELQQELDHWFWALKAISGEDPVPEEKRGRVKEMAEIWLKWGRQKGYVW